MLSELRQEEGFLGLSLARCGDVIAAPGRDWNATVSSRLNPEPRQHLEQSLPREAQ